MRYVSGNGTSPVRRPVKALLVAIFLLAGCAIKVDVDHSLIPPTPPPTDWITFSTKMSLAGDFSTSTVLSANVWVIRRDGTGLRALTQTDDASIHSLSPAFGPDKAVYFRSTGDFDGATGGTTSGYNLWKWQNGAVQRLTSFNGANLSVESFSISSSTGKIAFISKSKLNGSWTDAALPTNNLWVMDADGSNRTPLTPHTLATNSVASMSWDADGERIYFTGILSLTNTSNGARPNSANLFSILPDGSGFLALSTRTFNNSTAITPLPGQDGKMYFNSNWLLNGADTAIVTKSYLWRVNPNGTGAEPLVSSTTSTSLYISSPPVHGSTLTYFQTRDFLGTGNPTTDPRQIWELDTQTLTARQVTQFPVTHTYGAEAPATIMDGQKIVMFSRLNVSGEWADAEGVVNLWTISPDGTDPVPLTRNPTATTAGLSVPKDGAWILRDAEYMLFSE